MPVATVIVFEMPSFQMETRHLSNPTGTCERSWTKAVGYNLGCRSRSGIARLCRLEEEVERIVGSERWVGQAPPSASDCAEGY